MNSLEKYMIITFKSSVGAVHKNKIVVLGRRM